ncbi:hypothetical protein EC991_006998 [Linnemannia zychae]|nr:hypothetical protein EC991_006998 [Linnemannia zychae]
MIQTLENPKLQLDQTVMPTTSTLSMELSPYRSVSCDRLSSSEAPSPISDQGFFDMTTDDETASCYSPMLLPDKMHKHHNSYNKNDSVTMDQLHISGLFSLTRATSSKKRRAPLSLTRKQPPALEQIMLFSPNATAALTAGPAAMTPSPPSSFSTIPALSSSLKRDFSFSSSSSSRLSESDDDEDAKIGRTGPFLPSPFSNSSSFPYTAGGKNKRVRKASKSKHDKPKHPPVKLPFSVQRHITRSPPTSQCHRLRVYSIMMSETEIETSVRFYPKRAHGKKTVEIDLEYARARYLGDLQ